MIAYLTVLFFDERFNCIAENISFVRVSQMGEGAAPLTLPTNLKAPKNGYAYVYVSNESDEPVYFDNLQVAHNRGRIVEENHYYAYGLKIAGISSHKLADVNEGNTDNKYLYNDKELDDEGDLNWLDYGFRNYDLQIGRFVQVDPLTDEMPDMSTYHYAYNDPIGNIDEDGLIGVGSILAQVACQNSGSILQGLSTFLGQAATAIGSVSSVTLSIISSTASIAGHVGKQVSQNDRIGKQVGQQPKNKTVKEEEPTLNFDDLWKNYPKKVEHKDKNHKDIYDNHCAINVSDALEKSGIKLKKYKGATCDNDGDKKNMLWGRNNWPTGLISKKLRV